MTSSSGRRTSWPGSSTRACSAPFPMTSRQRSRAAATWTRSSPTTPTRTTIWGLPIFTGGTAHLLQHGHVRRGRHQRPARPRWTSSSGYANKLAEDGWQRQRHALRLQPPAERPGQRRRREVLDPAAPVRQDARQGDARGLRQVGRRLQRPRGRQAPPDLRRHRCATRSTPSTSTHDAKAFETEVTTAMFAARVVGRRRDRDECPGPRRPLRHRSRCRSATSAHGRGDVRARRRRRTPPAPGISSGS